MIMTSLVVFKDISNVTAVTGSEEEENIGLDYDFIYNVIKELSEIIFDDQVAKDYGIWKGRNFGTEGERYAAEKVRDWFVQNSDNLSADVYTERIGNESYGDENDADTWAGLILSATPGRPIVITRLPGQIGNTHVQLKGELWNTGGTDTCEVWFAYSSVSPNTLDQSTSTQILDSTGSFEIQLDGLTPQTKYWYRAVADNGYGQGIGDIFEFTTTPALGSISDGSEAKPYLQGRDTAEEFIESRIPAKYHYLLSNHPSVIKALEIL